MSATSSENDFNVSTEPPPITLNNSGYSITPGTKLQPRKVDPAAQVGAGVTFTPEEQADFTPEGYVGLKLVNGQGVIARNQYNDDEAYTELARMQPTERRNFLNTLYSLVFMVVHAHRQRVLGDKTLVLCVKRCCMQTLKV